MDTHPNDDDAAAASRPVRTRQALFRLLTPEVQIFLLPGGRMPERKSTEAVGYDVALRAIVSPSEMDPVNPMLRKTLFDFVHMPPAGDPNLAAEVVEDRDGLGNVELAYRLDPGKNVLVGIGFATAMPSGCFYWLAPRSGLASRYHVQVTTRREPWILITAARPARSSATAATNRSC